MADKHLRWRAAAHFPAYESVAAGMMNVLRQASKRLYGASEGRVWVDSWDFSPIGNCDAGCLGTDGTIAPCDFCFKNICGYCGEASCNGFVLPFCEILGCQGGTCAGATNGFFDEAFDGFSASKIVVHELGHHVGQPTMLDEYAPGGAAMCGHSLLGNEWGSTNFCNYWNHGLDGAAGLPAAGGRSNMDNLVSKGFGPDLRYLVVPENSGRRHDWADFDFDGQIGGVLAMGPAVPDPPPPPATVPSSNTWTLVGLAAGLAVLGAAGVNPRRVPRKGGK